MIRAALHQWKALTDDGSVRAVKYSFGPGSANTLAARLDDGTWMVVSPAVDAPLSVLDELASDGSVSALIAPNAYHHLGQAAWRQRFPDALSYAPDDALPRLTKKSSAVPYRPLTELAQSIGPRFELFAPDGMKSPDTMIRIASKRECVWWLGDLFSNSTADDQNWFLRVLSPLAGSGMGFRRNKRPGLVYVRDADAWLESVRGSITRNPPSVVVPAHGDCVLEDAAKRTEALLGKLHADPSG